MIKKCLIFVPHPDDEINVAGQLIYGFAKKNIHVKVCYLTNGDYVKNDGVKRIQEALAALRVLGIKDDDSIFLGYGDGWDSKKHIYNCESSEVVRSFAGQEETYGTDNKPDFSFCVRGKHNKYTRRNILNDLKLLIKQERASIIVCVDFDSHPDHRALSLLFEEAFCEIKKEDTSYSPIILKKFAYGGVYSGEMDYYDDFPILETKKSKAGKKLDSRFDVDNPYYCWEERIRINSPEECCTKYIFNNIIYKAAKCHKTQDIRKRIISICNSDITYWLRRTDNLIFESKIVVTSGNMSYLNDFKWFDCSDVRIGNDGAKIFDEGFWRPSINDLQKTITICFNDYFILRKLVLFQDVFHDGQILSFIIRTNNQIFRIKTTNMMPRIEVDLNGIYSNTLEIQIEETVGGLIGISEIEVYSEWDIDLEWVYNVFPSGVYRGKRNVILKTVDQLVTKQTRYSETKGNVYVNMISNLDKNIVENFLKHQGWDKVVIYGYGYIGNELAELLGDSLLACIDKRVGMIKCEYLIYDNIEKVDNKIIDVIIITSKDFKNISRELKDKKINNKKIISFSDFIIRIHDFEKCL